MKVSGGLIGITRIPSARTRFFLIAPAMAVLAAECKATTGIVSKQRGGHHEDTKAFLDLHECNVNNLAEVLQNLSLIHI